MKFYIITIFLFFILYINTAFSVIKYKNLIFIKKIITEKNILHQKNKKYFIKNKIENEEIYHIIINNNFISSAKNVGLSKNEIYTIISILDWKLDFLKLKKGNEFLVLVKKNKIIGIGFNKNNIVEYFFRAKNEIFYDSNGKSIVKSFMKFPIKTKYKISSNFSIHRFHPITKKNFPHLGVDFAVPIGTPIFSSGNGIVILAKKSKTAGKYIIIKHNLNYTTCYMHLNKILVKEGKRVKTGDLIAFSGNTGRSTGPHLHYEIWINNIPVNPIDAPLPVDSLSKEELEIYLQYTKKLLVKFHFK